MLFSIFLIATGALLVRGDCPRDNDPCSSDVYVELDDPTRSTRYPVIASGNENDYLLETNWYRSVSGAGGDMPTTPAYTGECSAFAPIWLNGAIPDQSENIVDLTGCVSFANNNCTSEYTIPVKNCGDYRVYCLSYTDDLFHRYCMGSELQCPDGFISATGFTPNCTESAEPGTGSCSLDIDPCSNYIELDEPSRSTSHYMEGASSEGDYTLAINWYRSVSGAGPDMPTSTVGPGQCNAYHPIWINGTLPGESDGVVQLTGCSSSISDYCLREHPIQVKNCGDFNVYCLPETTDVFDRFCFGSESPCPDGIPGFTPDCTLVEQTTADDAIETTSESDNKNKKEKKEDKNYLVILMAVCLAIGIILICLVVFIIILIKTKRVRWPSSNNINAAHTEAPPPYEGHSENDSSTNNYEVLPSKAERTSATAPITPGLPINKA